MNIKDIKDMFTPPRVKFLLSGKSSFEVKNLLGVTWINPERLFFLTWGSYQLCIIGGLSHIFSFYLLH